MTARLAAALAGLVILAVPACAGSPPDGEERELVVFAAASLTEPFTGLGDGFEAAHPGVRVRFSFAGSATLAQQINQGAPADVFASANPETMRTVTDAGNADGEPVTFAHNRLVIAVPAGNPHRITGLADLAAPGVTVALCAAQVPCGAAAGTALEAAGVALTPVTLEPDVRAALSRVRLGEVDAALVYHTDVATAASGVEGIEFPESASAVNDYPIVVLREAPHRTAGRAFVDHIRSAAGRAALTAAGFQVP